MVDDGKLWPVTNLLRTHCVPGEINSRRLSCKLIPSADATMAPEHETIDWSDLVTNGCDLRVDVDELFCDVPRIESVDDLAAPGVFNTDGELDEFLAFVRADRDASLA